MMWRSLIVVAAIVGLAGCSPKEEPVNDVVLGKGGPRHPVTAKMEGVTEKLTLTDAQLFELPTPSGAMIDLSSMLAKGPVMLYSIKDECPCSTDFEPFANAFQKRYDGKIQVIGIFNETPEKAMKWMEKHSTAHPVVIDSKLDTFKAYKMERSVYVSLISPDGKIIKSWPGYWTDMLTELDGKISELVGAPPTPYDAMYAPKDKSSGCQIYEGEGYTEGEVR